MTSIDKLQDADLVAIPVCFINDREDRGLDTPLLIKRVRANVWLIRKDDPALPDVISDAKYYADRWGPDQAPPSVKRGAKALLKALGSA